MPDTDRPAGKTYNTPLFGSRVKNVNPSNPSLHFNLVIYSRMLLNNTPSIFQRRVAYGKVLLREKMQSIRKTKDARHCGGITQSAA